MSGLDTAQIAIYSLLTIPVLYLLFRHGLQGIMGWGYLFAFCLLRIIGGALVLRNGPMDQTSAIISNIGLSPLLLSMSGILHEARYYRNSQLHTKIEWLLVIIYHFIVTTGLALIASGSSSLKLNNTGTSKDNLAKIGIVILLAVWVIICVWTLVSFLQSQYTRDAPAFANGSKLLYAVLVSLPFVGIRALYSVISILSPSKDFNPVNGALRFRLGLSFLMELIAIIGFILAGIATQGVRRKVKVVAHMNMRSPRRGGNRGETREGDVGLSEV